MPVVKADFVIVGGGVIGLAVAYNLTRRFSGTKTIVLEKETQIATHQSGRNSGVIHSGIYYKPGSLKAINCRKGKDALEKFCRQHGVRYERCGKVIVATSASEFDRLEALYERGRQNAVECAIIDAEALRLLEPHVHGLRAIHVPETGIVDYKQVCWQLSALVTTAGNEVHTGERLSRAESTTTETVAIVGETEYRCRFLINCAGLYADRVARLCGVRPRAAVIPFRGEYYILRPKARRLCRNLI